LVFRDSRRVLGGRDLLRTLQQSLDSILQLSDFRVQSSLDELVEALLRSGELECALADRDGCDRAAGTLARLTDQLALALVARSNSELGSSRQSIAALEVPEHVTVSIPEGFCYYALHPLDYADLLSENVIDAPAAAVVGIRSIGTTLSAVVRAWFELRGISAERITVRPTGHPFDRSLSLTERDRQWVAQGIQRGALFLIVDEGPGLSGSSFLAVAEALVQAGVAQNRIILLPSSSPNFSALLAPYVANRWGRFQTVPLEPTRRVPAGSAHDIGWGEWRKIVFPNQDEWPGVWSWTERRKLLSSDKRTLFRFDGHGHYGTIVRNRSQLLAEHAWAPETQSAGDGFSALPWIDGARITRADRDMVLQLAQYCAFRAANFEQPVASSDALQQMAQVNLERALGIHHTPVLPIERPVVPDARMMPHEWIATPERQLIKVDAASHGDDHFYPGPSDIAWDVAGAIVEWQLNQEAADLLIREYCRISHDAIGTRLPAYLIAYCVFRMGFMLSAAGSVSDATESTRLKRNADTYRQWLVSLLPCATAA